MKSQYFMLFLGTAQLLCNVDTKLQLHPELSFIISATIISKYIYGNTYIYHYHYECMLQTFLDNLWYTGPVQ